MAAPKPAGERIGDLLLREGLISREQLEKALQEQKASGTRVGYNLVKLGFIQEIELTKTLAKQYKMPAGDPSQDIPHPQNTPKNPTHPADAKTLRPLQRHGPPLHVAVAG